MLCMLVMAFVGGLFITQVANITTTIYLHRSLTHEAFKLKNPAHMFFRLVCWFTTVIIPRQWVAIHRKHHAFTDVEGDPHSPILEGFWGIQLFTAWYYAKEAAKIDINHWARGVPDYGWLDRHHLLGVLIGVLFACLIFGLIGLALDMNFFFGSLFGMLAAISHFLVFNFTNALINAYCHVRGYKTYPEADAFNSRWVALITYGEGLHNNHHKHQRNPRLRTGTRPCEVDLGWTAIKILDRLGYIYQKSELYPT